jgi:hypothetical protein
MKNDPLVDEFRHLAHCANVSLDGLREELKRSELQRDEMLKVLEQLELYARDLLLHIDGGKAERTFNLPKEITNAQSVIATARGDKHHFVELNPCPFCGGINTQVRENTIWTGMNHNVISVEVMHWCDDQQIKNLIVRKGKTREEAISDWNKRI